MTLLERAQPLAALGALWEEVRAGRGAMALVEGEAGIGKTSLVREFSGAIAAPARLALGACDALSTPRPLGPLHDVAATLRGELSRALVESRAPGALFQLLAAELSAAGPTLLVIEDVHWADAATLDLLRFLGRRVHGMRALVVITSRDDEVGPTHPLRVAIGDLASAGALRRISLQPLSAEAVDRLARGSRIDPRALHRQTGGNPFYVTEVLASGGGLPGNVRDAVLSRAARLAPAARRTLDAAAVIGASAEVALLAAAAGSDLSLEPCIQAGLLRAQPSLVSFRHEIARQAVLGAIAPDALRNWHARILAALRGRSADLAMLAHHAAGALDGAAVLQFAPEAARQAASLRSHREAAAQYARALAFAAPLPPAQRADLMEGYSYECYLTDQPAEAIRARTAAAALRESLGDRLRYGDDLRWLSRFQWWSSNRPEAERLGARAVEVLQALPPGPELAAALSNLSQLSLMASEGAAAIRWGRKALSLARRARDENVEAHALNNIGTARVLTGDRRGWADLGKSLQLSLDRGFEDHAARAYNNLGSEAVSTRRLADGDGWLRDGIAYDDDRGLDGHRAYLLGWQAMSHLFQGRLDAALESAHEALSNRRLSGILRVNPLCAIGRARALRGDPEIWPPLDEAAELAHRTGELQRIGQACIARSEAAWLAGDDARARAEAERGLPLALERRGTNGWIAGELLLCHWRAGGKRRMPSWCPQVFRDETQGNASKAERAWRKLGCPPQAALALAERGGETALRQAFDELERLGMRAAAARVAEKLRKMGARHIPRGRRASTRANPQGLTAREVEILDLLVESLSNAAIGKRLFISPKTVDHHVSAILEKLGVHTRAEAARWRRGSRSA